MPGGVSFPDPFLMRSELSSPAGPGSNDTKNSSLRSAVIDPSKKTCVLIIAGQSLSTNITPTYYAPTTSATIDHLNVYDGGLYSVSGPLCGCTTYLTIGPGNVAVRIADLLVTNGKFDRVIICNVAMGGTAVSDWATGFCSERVPQVMRRLASRGITPATPGVTFAMVWEQGEADVGITSQIDYTSRWNTFYANYVAAGFSGRTFVNLETTPGDTTSGVRLAQAALANGTTIFQGGNWNNISAGNRADGTHFNDTGAALGAVAVVNAMAASGAPF